MRRGIDQRRIRVAVTLLGLVLPQLALFAPAFFGRTVLLPLDLLALSQIYLPATPEYAAVQPGNPSFTDLLFEYEMNRSFAATEVRAGRIPLWNSDSYAGAPFANFPKYSPFLWPYYLFDGPRTLVWIQLLTSLVAGLGAYAFFRIALRLSFWPSALVAWCVPISGFFVLWQGFPLTYSAACFPWLLLAVDRATRDARFGPAVALATLLTLIAGQVDIGGQALLASGFYALGLFAYQGGVAFRNREVSVSGSTLPLRKLLARGAGLAGGWGIGILLATPYLLPLLEYARTGARIAGRMGGAEERPPIGLSAIPQFFDPNFYGSARAGSIYFGSGNHLESPAAAYAGLLLTLVLAPLAWRSRRHRGICLILGLITLLALSWDLAIPGLVDLWRTPALRFLSYNRFVFVSAFTIAALAAIGLDSLRDGRRLTWRWILPLATTPLALGSWALYRTVHQPETLTRLLAQSTGGPGHHLIDTPEKIAGVVGSWLAGSTLHATVAGLAVISLLLLTRWRWAPSAIGILAVLELVVFGSGYAPQGDPTLYFPPIQTLDTLPTQDRVIGVNCLPPNLHRKFDFRDLRGYDGVDPAALVDLLDLCRDPRIPIVEYARAQYFVPRVQLTGDGQAELPPVLSMANVRYLVFRGVPPAHARAFSSHDDYWCLENPKALPRAFVPARVETVQDPAARLAKLGRPDFDPRSVAYVDVELSLAEPCAGEATIVDAKHAGRLAIRAQMATAGLLVISDLWDPGWQARVNGRRVPILRANHAFRGVVLPAGPNEVLFNYRPRSLLIGVICLACGTALIGIWVLLTRSRRWNGETPEEYRGPNHEGTRAATSLP